MWSGIPFNALVNLSRIKWLVAGSAFVVLGIIGLFLPILQGVLFIVIGLMCLTKGSALIRSKKMTLKKRFPKFGSKLTLLEQKAETLAMPPAGGPVVRPSSECTVDKIRNVDVVGTLVTPICRGHKQSLRIFA